MQIGQVQIGRGDAAFGLSNNQLKILAMVAMALDHTGKALLPDCAWLQMIGRLSFPIFAYMIAEGCRYTKHRWHYFLHLAVLAFGCQLVFGLVMRSLIMGILVTFSLSVLLIYAIDFFLQRRQALPFFVMTVTAAAVLLLSEGIAWCFPESGYVLDYGIYGVLFPAVIYYLPGVWAKLGGASVMLLIKAVLAGGFHWYGLCSLPLLLLYNGKRGKYKLKYLFYVFYPVHLVLIYFVQLLLFWWRYGGA